MKPLFTLLLAALSSFGLLAQANYFQQEVNYKIAVSLDDKTHTLSGNVDIEYTNNSRDALPFIYFHLWANGYKNRETAFAKQTVNHGNPTFYFADKKDLGGFTDIQFLVNGQSLEWTNEKQTPDIVKVMLKTPLQSGQSIDISIPFTLDIPLTFSRLGHTEDAYQMTQWYPKPAVYDRDGWHPMPYLESGEYYSEFGDFEVEITLPRNYVVGATGVLQTESEYQFLEQKIKETNQFIQNGFPDTLGFPASSLEMKTIRYTAENVHDFAWFADKRFHVQSGAATLSNGKEVKTWAMFTNLEADLWKSAADYLARSVQFFSKAVGIYPYPQVTAVENPLFAGGAMEYPMITVVAEVGSGQALDRYITHEIGHNWFYGILATNERDFPWMDEGINSYYENRYMNQYYDDPDGDIISPSMENFLGGGAPIYYDELAYLYMARRNVDQAPQTTALDLTNVNYGVSAYVKPALAFKMLESYVGRDVFDRALQNYYEAWQFKHPQPDDFRRIINETIEKPLDWLFDGLLYSTDKMDYALKSVNKDASKIKIENKGALSAPFPVSGMRDGQIIETKWYEGVEGEQELDFPAGDYDKVVLDADRITLDLHRNNNTLKVGGGLTGMEPLKLKVLAGVENPERTTIYWLPLIGGNKYDGFMIGAGFYNRMFPARRFEYAIAPLLGIKSTDLAGAGQLKYNFYPKSGALRKWSIGLSARRFNYNYNEANDYFLTYRKLQPHLHFELSKKLTSPIKQYINFRSIFLTDDLPRFDTTGTFTGTEVDNSLIHELSYTIEKNSVVNPFRLRIALEQQSYERRILTTVFNESYLKASLEWITNYTYKESKNVTLRIFAGYFLNNTRREAGNVANRGTRGSLALTYQGFNDYKYDDFFFGRSESDGWHSQQIMIKDGGMKNAFGSSFKKGISNDFIFAINLKADLPQSLPLDIPLKPYFDVGYFHNAQPTGANDTFNDQLLWSGGLMLEFGSRVFKDAILGIYFPLVNSENIKMAYDGRNEGKYFSRVTFSLNLNALNPWEMIDNFPF